MQGGKDETAEALGRGDLAAAAVTDQERVLLSLVELLTRHAYRCTAEEIELLRAVGWNDAQIAEAVYITALFAFFNRVADAFGLIDPNYRGMAAAGNAIQPGNAPASAAPDQKDAR